MKTYNIVNLLVNDYSDFNYGFPIVDNEGTEIELYNSVQFFTLIAHKYPSFAILCPRYYDDDEHKMVDMIPDRDDAIAFLHVIYDIWYNDRKEGVQLLYNTFRAKYNPLWNVDGVEGHIEESKHGGDSSDVHSGNDRFQRGSGYTNVRTGNETDTPTGSNTVTTAKTTFDDNSFKDTDKVTDSPGVTGTHTYNNVTDTNTGKGEDKTLYGSTMTHKQNLTNDLLSLHIRQGNIGITSSQSLIRQQYDITSLDQLINIMINDFVHTNLIQV